VGSLNRELEQLQKLLRDSGRDEREPIYFSLHDWADDAPTTFEEAEAEDAISRLMPAALDRLIEAGKITERERDRVIFIVRTIINPKSLSK
jgi:hypothetical protein